MPCLSSCYKEISAPTLGQPFLLCPESHLTCLLKDLIPVTFLFVSHIINFIPLTSRYTLYSPCLLPATTQSTPLRSRTSQKSCHYSFSPLPNLQFTFLNYFYFFHYTWFTVFCQFLLYSKMTQLYIYIFFFSHYPPSCSITSD